MKTTYKRRLSFRNQWKISFLVVWFLALLFFGGSGVFAQSYTPIFSEDFSLEENHSPVGNGWKATTNNPNPLSCGTTGDNAWEVRNGRLQPRCYQSSNPILLRPSSESLKNGRADILFTVFSGNVNEYAQWRIIARHTYDTGNNINYYYEGVISPGHNWIAVGRKNSTNNNYALSSMKSSLITIPVDTLLKAELITESISSSETRITLNLYNLGDGGNLLATTTMLDTTPELQQSGQWGVWTNQRPTVNKFDLYAIDADINISAVNAISFGNDLTIHLVDDGDNVITFSDDTGGIFSPNPVILNAENNYQATVLYSPIKAGNVIISGTQSANNSKEIRHKLFVSPYTTIIGFIGDSISLDANYHTVEETILNLISGFSSSNVASNGSTSTSWINNNTNIAQMYNSGVEVVSIMLGTNDTRQDQKRTPEAYKVSMQALIDKLKDDFRLVILNEPPAIDRNQSFASSLWDEQSNTRLSGYIEKLNELVMENDGFVIRGDTTVYQYFMDNPTCLGDGIHPNNCGKIYIGKQWANAIKSALDYQINPNAEFIGANGDEHTLWTSWSLTLRVDKYFDEFTNVVKVDNIQLTSDKYVATSGSTNIELNADYLNTLFTGNHTLSVGFYGGVWVNGDFSILPDPTIVPPVNPPVVPPTTTPTIPTSSWWGGGSSLSKDTCPSGDFSPSYYDKTCWTTADLAEEVAKKVNLLKLLVARIYLIGNDKWKTFIFDLITSCSQTNKNEVIKLACQELVANRDF